MRRQGVTRHERQQLPSIGEASELFRAMRGGDLGARESLITKCLPLVDCIARREYKSLGNYSVGIDGDDLASVGMVALVETLDGMATGENVAGYLEKAVTGAVRDYVRGERDNAKAYLASDHPGPWKAIAAPKAEDMADAIRGAAKLPGDEEILTLLVDGYSQREICGRLGMKPSTVSDRIRKCGWKILDAAGFPG